MVEGSGRVFVDFTPHSPKESGLRQLQASDKRDPTCVGASSYIC